MNAILSRAGIDWEKFGELTESSDTSSVSAFGYAVFKVCDGENAALLQLREAWVARAVNIGFLNICPEEKAEVSQAVIGQVRAEILRVVQAYVDSWLAIAAVKVGCAPQAIRYVDFALADSSNEFADGILAPVWQVNPDTLPKLNELRPAKHGSADWIPAVVVSFLAPEWPTALAVLRVKGQEEAVAAYAFASLFSTNSKLSGFNNHLSLLDNAPDNNALVWQAYGKAETKAQLERAASAITLSAPENGLAIVKIFGHEFLLASGERNSSTDAWDATRWYTLAEIQGKFRDSYPFKALSGQ